MLNISCTEDNYIAFWCILATVNLCYLVFSWFQWFSHGIRLMCRNCVLILFVFDGAQHRRLYAILMQTASNLDNRETKLALPKVDNFLILIRQVLCKKTTELYSRFDGILFFLTTNPDSVSSPQNFNFVKQLSATM